MFEHNPKPAVLRWSQATMLRSMSYKMPFSNTSLLVDVVQQHRQKAAVCIISHVYLYTQLAINNNKVPLDKKLTNLGCVEHDFAVCGRRPF